MMIWPFSLIKASRELSDLRDLVHVLYEENEAVHQMMDDVIHRRDTLQKNLDESQEHLLSLVQISANQKSKIESQAEVIQTLLDALRSAAIEVSPKSRAKICRTIELADQKPNPLKEATNAA